MMQTQVQKESIEKAIEMAKIFGMLKYLPEGKLTHVPFSLSPYSINGKVLEEMLELNPYFNELMIRVSQDWNFLEETLTPISKADPFLKMLLELRNNDSLQNKQLLLQRNDFFLIPDQFSDSSELSYDSEIDYPISSIRQVEINTVSASFLFLTTQLSRLHQKLFELGNLKNIVPNNPLKSVVEAFAKAINDYGSENSVMLMVVQRGETNSFDQLGMEMLLWDYYHIQTIRKTLSEIYESGRIREGHLVLGGKKVAITYYRAGYEPNDFHPINAIKGRQLIESSSTIQVPDLAMHLAGMKKIQQVLSSPKILSTFVSEKISRRLLSTFVSMYSLDEIIETPFGNLSAMEWASRNPEKYILKPQREGGGNNYFGIDIPLKMASLNSQEKGAYVLMEKIQAEKHQAILIANDNFEIATSVSEVGRFGICFVENGTLQSNEDVGYLVRTKSETVNEGGVCAGYACLNSLTKL